MRNIALILMYNGSAYHGWQVQKTEISVAATLERGLSMVCGEPIRVVGCGRTDAGVHAEHYVANFHTTSAIPTDRLLIETDCPYLAPHPMRGKLNHSGYLHYTAEAIADTIGFTPDEVAQLTCTNAKMLFDI